MTGTACAFRALSADGATVATESGSRPLESLLHSGELVESASYETQTGVLILVLKTRMSQRFIKLAESRKKFFEVVWENQTNFEPEPEPGPTQEFWVDSDPDKWSESSTFHWTLGYKDQTMAKPYRKGLVT